MKKTVSWTCRWPASLHKIAAEIARKNNRSMNDQVIYWLEHGGMSNDLFACELDVLKARYISLIDEGVASGPGIREQKFQEAEEVRDRLAAMVDART